MNKLLFLLLLFSNIALGQGQFPSYVPERMELNTKSSATHRIRPDVLVLQGDSIRLEIYNELDSVVIHDPNGNATILVSKSWDINGRSPSTGDLYFCQVFGNAEIGTFVEYWINPNTLEWSFVITFENSQMSDGRAEKIRPFGPLFNRKIKKI